MEELNKSLSKAAKNGDIDLVSALIESGADISFPSGISKLTPLHLAAQQGHEPVITVLLKPGALTDAKDITGWTSLHFAAHAGHVPVILYLLSNGALLEEKTNEKKTPLHLAALNGHEPVVSVLLMEGALIDEKDFLGWTSLHFAAHDGHVPVILCLLSNGALLEEKTDEERTPLHLAALNGHEPVVSVLLKEGALINARDLSGWTPLHFAANEGHVPVILCLLRNGALLEAKTDEEGSCFLKFSDFSTFVQIKSAKGKKMTPLHLAACFGHEPVVSVLLKAGALINAKDSSDQTPLHLAAIGGHKEVIADLLKNRGELDVKDSEGHTPLQLAAFEFNEASIVNTCTYNTLYVVYFHVKSQLHSAARFDIEDAITMSLQNGDPIDGRNSKGLTPLHVASISGSESATTALIMNGAFIDDKDNMGKTAQDLAEEYNCRNIIKLYKKILASGLPKELLYLSSNDRATFTSNLRSGFYLSYVGKIMCVGCEAVGKTAIISVLKGGKPSRKRRPTEGLDLHIYKASVEMSNRTWIFKALDLMDVAFRDLLNKPNWKFQDLNALLDGDDDDDEEEENEYSDDDGCRIKIPPSATLDHTGAANQECKTSSSRKEYKKSKLQKFRAKFGLKKAEIRSIGGMQAEAVRRSKTGLLSSTLAPINMVDFGGQGAFYSTHQSFLTYRGIYILVLDGSKGFDDEIETEPIIPGRYGKPTSRTFTFFWVNSIESCSKGASDKYPKILVVCTHKDKVEKHLVDQRAETIFSEIEKMFKDTTALNHLVLEHRIFLNAMDPEDPKYEKLKQVLVELLCSQPSWGEKLPKSWIYLKMMINRAVEKGDRVMKMTTLRQINQDNPVQILSEKEIQLFLKMLHSQGEIIHFPLSELRDNVVIVPKFLVDALRSLVTNTQFCKGNRLRTIQSMNRTGLLKKKEILLIWKSNTEFRDHQGYLISLMEHLDILATPRKYGKSGTLMNSEIFYVPSLVQTVNDTSYLEDNLATRSLGLSFKFHSSVLPPSIGYRLIASCVGMYEIQRYNNKMMLFSGMVVVRVKRNLDLVVISRTDRVDIFLVHSSKRFEIPRDTAAGIYECMKDILISILESYRVTSSEGKIKHDVPFHTEFQCYNTTEPCYNQLQTSWTCKHGYTLGLDLKEKWCHNREKHICTAECEDLSETDYVEKPSEGQLANLAMQFSWEDMYKLAIALGLEVVEIDRIQKDHGDNVLNLMFLCLLKWRKKIHGCVGDIIKALKDAELDGRKVCQMVRNRKLSESVSRSVFNQQVTDKVIDAISNGVIEESLLLSVQLGEKASYWIGMKLDRTRIVEINRVVLHKWKLQHPKKDQMTALAQALCNVGTEINSILSELSE